MRLIDADELLRRLQNLHLMAISGYGAEEYVAKVVEEMAEEQPEETAGGGNDETDRR